MWIRPKVVLMEKEGCCCVQEPSYLIIETNLVSHLHQFCIGSLRPHGTYMDQIQTSAAILSDQTSTDSRARLDRIEEVPCFCKACQLQFGNRANWIHSCAQSLRFAKSHRQSCHSQASCDIFIAPFSMLLLSIPSLFNVTDIRIRRILVGFVRISSAQMASM